MLRRVKMQHRGARPIAGRLRHDDGGLREPIRLEVHREQARIARRRLEGDGAREAFGAQRIDGVGADMGADIDEHRIRRQATGRRQHLDRGIDLAPLPFAVPHQPGADHPIGGIDEEAHVAELAEHELTACRQRLHDGVAQHRPADQQRLEHRAPQRPPATTVGPFDLAPGLTPSHLTPSAAASASPCICFARAESASPA